MAKYHDMEIISRPTGIQQAEMREKLSFVTGWLRLTFDFYNYPIFDYDVSAKTAVRVL